MKTIWGNLVSMARIKSSARVALMSSWRVSRRTQMRKAEAET